MGALLARDKWRSDWFGRVAGPVYLSFPRIAGIPRELRATVIRSWAPAFVVVGYKRGGGTFYRFSYRPPRGVKARAILRLQLGAGLVRLTKRNRPRITSRPVVRFTHRTKRRRPRSHRLSHRNHLFGWSDRKEGIYHGLIKYVVYGIWLDSLFGRAKKRYKHQKKLY